MSGKATSYVLLTGKATGSAFCSGATVRRAIDGPRSFLCALVYVLDGQAGGRVQQLMGR